MRGVDFEIAEGEVFGLLGPNGAGKTTTVEILEGYRSATRARSQSSATIRSGPGPSSGSASASCCSSPSSGRTLTVRETHRVFAGYYERPRDVDEVIELVGLVDEARTRA